MPHVYDGVDELVKGKTDFAGDGECVALIKEYVPGLKGKSTSTWRPGAWVMESAGKISKGTAIATFDIDGSFPKRNTGQHAAIVLSVVPSGIWVVDQWKGKAKITMRLIRVPPKRAQLRNPDGSWPSWNRSNNALAFQVIE